MAFINVAEWTPRHVVQYLQGLERCIQPYVQFFFDNQINGTRLLSLTYEDLERIHITKIGHQEIIQDSIDLLRHLHYNSSSENLQSLALKLGCKSRSLYNYLKKESKCGKCENCISKLNDSLQPEYDENEENQLIYSNLFPQYKKSISTIRKPMPEKKMCRKITTFTIASVCDILLSVKQFVNWIDRYSFERLDHYTLIRQTILRISIELASTTQRDHFVENPKAIIIYNCLKFANICDTIVQELNDSLMIQPTCLEMVPIKMNKNEELGVNIYSSYRGVHIIGDIKIQTPAHRCGRIDEGDEIIQVNYQTVLGWSQRKVILAMQEYPTKIVITVKKRPSHCRIAGQLRVLEPTKIPHRQVCIQENPQAFQEFTYSLDVVPQENSKNYVIEQEDEVKENNALVINSNKCCKHESIYLSTTPSSISRSSICIQNHENKECCEQNTNQHKQLIEQMSIEKPAKGPVYQMSNKPKKLKRRATIHGLVTGDIHTLNPPIRLEDLVNLNNTENYCLNLNKSMKSSHLNVMNNNQGTISTNGNLHKSFNNLYSTTTVDYLLDDQLNPTIRSDKSAFTSKRACSEDNSSQSIKRCTVSVCQNEPYSNELYVTSVTSMTKAKNPSIDKVRQFNNRIIDDEKFNQENDEKYIIHHNNTTVIKVNSSQVDSDQYTNFGQVNENHIQVTSDNKNIVHVLGKESDLLTLNESQQNTTMEQQIVSRRSNKQSQSLQPSLLKKEEAPNQVKNDDLKIDKNNELQDAKQDVHSSDRNSLNKPDVLKENSQLKPEVLKVKKSLNKQAKLIKLNLSQLSSNSDHQGWLFYLREELNLVKQTSQTNFESLNLNRPDLKWRENYLVLKHELLYFYSGDEDELQPCRIINLQTFELCDQLDYRTGMHVIKIKSQKYRFYFASKDLNSLNEWIAKFKVIFDQKNNHMDTDEPNLATTKITSNDNQKDDKHSFNSFNEDRQDHLIQNFRHAHSFRDLNSVQNHLNGIMSRSTAQIIDKQLDKQMNYYRANKLNNLESDDQQYEQNVYKLSTKYFSNGSYLRSQSCVDSNLLNKYTRARLINRELKDSNEREKAINHKLNSILPPLSASTQTKSQHLTHLINKINLIN